MMKSDDRVKSGGMEMGEEILLVEDDVEIARIIRDTLRQEGYGVTWATTGIEEETTIRGNQATKMEMGEFRSLDWVEDGLKYVVLIENPEIEFEDMAQYLEEMELVE